MSNGYTTIDIKGQTVGLTFGLPAIKRIMEKTVEYSLAVEHKNENGEVVSSTYTEAGMTHILFAGYLNNCYADDQKPVLKFRDFTELLEDAVINPENGEQIRDAIKVFEESKAVKKFLHAPETEVKKKNGIGMKSKVSATVS